MNERERGAHKYRTRDESKASEPESRQIGGRVAQSGFCCQISIVMLSNPQKSWHFFVGNFIWFYHCIYLITIAWNEETRWRVSKVKDSMTYHPQTVHKVANVRSYTHKHKIKEIEMKKNVWQQAREINIHIVATMITNDKKHTKNLLLCGIIELDLA